MLIDGYSDEDLPFLFTLDKDKVGALINTKNNNFPGISFISPKAVESEFLQVLDTFKFN